MNFMRSDEYLLLMNLCEGMPGEYAPYTLSERIRLRDVGIQTAIEYPEWSKTEPVRGEYNFSLIEGILELNRGAGIKTIFAVPEHWIPKWIPNEWRLKYHNGNYITSSISLWNKEAVQYRDDYLTMLIDRYHAPDVLFVFTENDTGESVMVSYGWYDDCAVKDFQSKYDVAMDFDNIQTKEWLANSAISYITETQKIFYPQYKELWNMNQWLINKINPASMNSIHPEILKSFRDTFDPLSLVLLQYTYFDAAHPQENVVYVDKLVSDYGCEVIAEAMFCKGLPQTAPRAIAKGFRGQIICPTHLTTGEKKLQDWMINAISDAHKLWEKNENNSNSENA